VPQYPRSNPNKGIFVRPKSRLSHHPATAACTCSTCSVLVSTRIRSISNYCKAFLLNSRHHPSLMMQFDALARNPLRKFNWWRVFRCIHAQLTISTYCCKSWLRTKTSRRHVENFPGPGRAKSFVVPRDHQRHIIALVLLMRDSFVKDTHTTCR
jgi:hypothetical protein